MNETLRAHILIYCCMPTFQREIPFVMRLKLLSLIYLGPVDGYRRWEGLVPLLLKLVFTTKCERGYYDSLIVKQSLY